MSYSGLTRPAITDIRNRVYANIKSKLPTQDANLRYTVTNILAEALIGLAHEQYGYIDYGMDQTNILYCEGENLDLYGVIWNTPRKPATKSIGTLTIYGTAGTIVPDQTVFTTSDGIQYRVTNTALTAIITTSVDLAITAVQTGSIGNKPVGTQLNILSPFAGLTGKAILAGVNGTYSGSDTEADDTYRTRLIARINQPAHGGNIADYEAWALEVPNVTRAWVTNPAPGYVYVYFATDNTTVNGIPTGGDVTALQTYLNSSTRKPITANVTAVAPTAAPLNITINNLYPDNINVRANITNELTELFRVKAEPGTIIYKSWVFDAIANATGNNHFDIPSFTSEFITHTATQLPVLGTITYTVV